MVRRLYQNCMLGIKDVPPSRDNMEVVGVFNPGAIELDNGEVVLLVRVAERLQEKREGYVGLPRYEADGEPVIDWLSEHDIEWIDVRGVRLKRDMTTRLTFISHLRVVRSNDGREVTEVTDVTFEPATPYETYGVEDPRIVKLGDQYVINYTAVSNHGACTAMAFTRDFKTFDRQGIIFPLENKDVCIFPEQINGQYWAFHRPSGSMRFTIPEMWLSSSPDLIHWGDHQPFLGHVADWDTGRIGGGCPPIRTDAGWLEIYHGNILMERAGEVGVYSGGAFMVDLNDPRKLIRHSSSPIMVPEADFEKKGFLPGVVFPTGIIDRGDHYLIYYGAADESVGVVAMSKEELLGCCDELD